jgi:hypothetical protein
MNNKKWDEFSEYSKETLASRRSDFLPFPTDNLDDAQRLLNINWNSFKNIIIKSANHCIPTKKVSSGLKLSDDYPQRLLDLKTDIRCVNRTLQILYNISPSPFTASSSSQSHVQSLWTKLDTHSQRSPRDEIIRINKWHDFPVDQDSFSFFIPFGNYDRLGYFYKQFTLLRNALQRIMKVIERDHNKSLIKNYVNSRCTNFASNKADFISSSLSRTRRSIVLDRVLTTDDNGNFNLTTDPDQIKEIAINHFKFIAGDSITEQFTLNDMSEFWQSLYTPINSIDPHIYANLLAEPSDSEWSSTISALPNNKVAGPSGISYEMLKHMDSSCSLLLKDLVYTCFRSGFIPKEWKDATVYPIPKPHDWECQLKNTRPITLLETARKLMVKILNQRLSSIFFKHSVLTSKNFAGLPGGSCHTPIFILESILHDARTFNKPLFIFLQDISKAFDSIDINMLRLAMNRLKIPTLFTDLVLQLFSDRSNRILTAFGNTEPYSVHIGIDQGEVISPLLWVIYIDPLLTALNNTNKAPYTLSAVLPNSSPYPQQPTDITVFSQDISTLAFMDDTTLVTSDISALTNMLNLANEFYAMNNTKINFSKANLITNRDPSNPSALLPKSPTSFAFNLERASFNITPLASDSSFRFLGVWFSVKGSMSFIKQQCRTEYSTFAAKLRKKKLTTRQLVYLHNTVLLPKVEYRLMTTVLTQDECHRIMTPIKAVIKQSSKFAITLPFAFLHYERGINMTNLYDRHLQNHISSIPRRFHASPILSNIYLIRLHQLSDSL